METLFLGLAVPNSVVDGLAPALNHYSSVIARQIPPDKLHITLLWLGPETKATRDLIGHLREPMPQSFVPTIRLTHCGRGLSHDQLWAYCEASGPIMTIQQQIQERLSRIGWQQPTSNTQQPFVPHITLARLSDQVSHVGVADYPFITSFTATDVLLYKSTPTTYQQSTYSILEHIPLT